MQMYQKKEKLYSHKYFQDIQSSMKSYIDFQGSSQKMMYVLLWIKIVSIGLISLDFLNHLVKACGKTCENLHVLKLEDSYKLCHVFAKYM